MREQLKPPFEAPFTKEQDVANTNYFLQDIAESLRMLTAAQEHPVVVVDGKPYPLQPDYSLGDWESRVDSDGVKRLHWKIKE